MSDQRLIRATALLFCLRFLAAFLIDLAPQETYYWNYAEHPALSYFDHPPMIAWVIGAGQFFLGKNALGVRLGGLLLTLLSTWLLYTLGRFWFNRRAGLWAALLFQLIPLYFVYGLLITPDVPLIFFWLLTLYLVSLAVREEKKWAWYLAGAALGLCLLSKYTAIFLVPSTLLWLILDRCYRQWLMRKEPYLALLIAALFFTPVILWNVEHDWASFGFQVSERLARAPSQPTQKLGRIFAHAARRDFAHSSGRLTHDPGASCVVRFERLASPMAVLFSFLDPDPRLHAAFQHSFRSQGQLDAARLSTSARRRLSVLPLFSFQQRRSQAARGQVFLALFFLRFASSVCRCGLSLNSNDTGNSHAQFYDRLERVGSRPSAGKHEPLRSPAEKRCSFWVWIVTTSLPLFRFIAMTAAKFSRVTSSANARWPSNTGRQK